MKLKFGNTISPFNKKQITLIGIISISLIIAGIYCINFPPFYPIKVDFVIKSIIPKSTTYQKEVGNINGVYITENKIKTVYNLTGTVDICGNNVITLLSYSKLVNLGQTITAFMKPSCLNNEASESDGNLKLFGWVLIIIAVIILIMNILKFILK